MLAAIPPPPFQGFEIGPLDLRLYGLLIAIGAFLALQMTVRRYERLGGSGDIAEKAALLALLFGFLGARIGYVIPRFVSGPNPFIDRPLEIFAIWQGGLAFFGGLVGGALAVIIYVRRKGADMPAMADAIAPALPLAQSIGRWGNYFNQELFGRPTDLPWALRVDPVPAGTAAQFPGASTFHPTFLYESLWNAVLVIVILWLDRIGVLTRRGSLIFVYLIGYGVGRGWIEALRVDTVERYFGLSRNNWIAIAIVLIGVAGLIWWERRESDRPAIEDLTEPVVDDEGTPVLGNAEVRVIDPDDVTGEGNEPPDDAEGSSADPDDTNDTPGDQGDNASR